MSKLRVDKIAAPIVQDEFTGSVYFDGNGDRLSIADNTDFSFGTGDFTIECWAYSRKALTGTAYTLDYAHIAGKGSGVPDSTYALGFFEQKATFTSATGGSFTNHKGATTLTNNTWYHLAVTRENGTLRIFVNGVLDYSTTLTIDFTNSKSFNIGDRESSDPHGQYPLDGYVSNLRVCKGHAVYTGNFTPPTRELEVHTKPPKGVVFPAIDNVTTLLACQSSTDATADSSGRHTITAAGNATAADANPGLLRRTTSVGITTTTTGSVYFDGTDDSLNIAANVDFAYGTGDFTWEFWFKAEAGFVEGNGGYLIDHAPADSDGNDGSVWVGSNTLYYHSAGVGGVSNLSFGGVSNETWYHVAVARESGTTRLFLNGALVNSASDSANFTTNNTRFRIGDYIGSGYAFKGYISNLRICKGHAVYTEKFTPPTRELEVHEGPDDNRTVLLACYDGENIFADKTGRHIISSIGDRTSSPTPIATDSPIGITTHNPGLTRNVDPTAGPTFQGGAGFTSQNWLTLPKGTTEQRHPTGGYASGSTRAVAMGGDGSPSDAVIDYINVETLGDAAAFGSLAVEDAYNADAVGSRTRGVVFGGRTTNPSPNSTSNVVQYITFMSTGSSLDFGDLSTKRYGNAAFSDSTRGISAAGGVAFDSTNAIDYITISTLGNTKDFGDCANALTYRAGFSSPTRGIIAGGGVTPGSGAENNSIEYITIQTTGNGQDFGDLVTAAWRLGGCSNAVRGVIMEGETPAGDGLNAMSFVTIASMGNAQDFGDATTAGQHSNGTASSTRGVFMGRQAASPYSNLTFMDYVHIMTTGNAVDFGNLSAGRQGVNACSNGHGGLG